MNSQVVSSTTDISRIMWDVCKCTVQQKHNDCLTVSASVISLLSQIMASSGEMYQDMKKIILMVVIAFL